MKIANDSINKSPQFDRVNAAIAAVVFAFSCIVYLLTMAPTFSFWDCGEFVACSYILGIAHPPGSPLYILIGRIFMLLPFTSDVAVCTNLLSVVSSSFTALFSYLILVRILRFWFKEIRSLYDRLTIYIGGFTGALFVAFGSTNWANSVESEVYAVTMAIMLAIYWLALKYFSERNKLSGLRAMLLAMFLAVLGIGIHLTLYAIVPVVAIYFILKEDATDRHWMAVTVFFLLELYFIFRLSSRPDELPFYLTTLIIFVLFIFHILQWKSLSKSALVTLGLYLVALYSFYFKLADNLVTRLGSDGISATAKSIGELPLGWIGLIGLAMWSAYLLYQSYGRGKKDSDKSEQVILALYSLTPIVLIGLGEMLAAFDPYSTFKVLTVLLVLGLLVYMKKLVTWSMAAAIAGISMIMLGFWPFVWGVVGGAVAAVLIGILFKDRSWKIALAVIVLAALGFSVHGYIPIRSAHNPAIDENNPSESLTAMVNYLERKQYGQETMTSRMFKRRAEWENQFGDFRRMGFWRFFKEQYGLDGSRFFIFFILGLFGMWETIRRKVSIGLPFLIMTIVCTLGIVLYMNFADGTRIDPMTGQDYLEVRDRDYFFTAGFIFFGMAIGLGIAATLALIRDTLKNSSPILQKSAFAAGSLLIFLPLAPLNTNYFVNDRSRNYMPYDYAYNLLKPCEKDAIFITNGDNDTFPVWCLQEAYGIRKDVQTVNLSLANAPWYIKQLAHAGLPISWSDAQIERLHPYQASDGTVYRLQDMVIDEIITQNKNRRPVYVSVTTPGSNRRYLGQSLDSNLVLEGMVYKYTENKGADLINYEKALRMYEHEYQYRGIADSTVYKDEATVRIVNNYSQGILWLADTLRRAGDSEGALQRIFNGIEVLPNSHDLYGYGTQLLADMGRYDTLETFVKNARTDNKERLYSLWGHSARSRGDVENAIRAFELLNRNFPDSEDGFRALASLYYHQKYYAKLINLLEAWLSRHPEDEAVKSAINEVQVQLASPDTGKGN